MVRVRCGRVRISKISILLLFKVLNNTEIRETFQKQNKEKLINLNLAALSFKLVKFFLIKIIYCLLYSIETKFFLFIEY